MTYTYTPRWGAPTVTVECREFRCIKPKADKIGPTALTTDLNGGSGWEEGLIFKVDIKRIPTNQKERFILWPIDGRSGIFSDWTEEIGIKWRDRL